jgi:hypothetical protein
MNQKFQNILEKLFSSGENQSDAVLLDPVPQFNKNISENKDMARQINAAFLIELAGDNHPKYSDAVSCLNQFIDEVEWKEVVHFYKMGRERIAREMAEALKVYPKVARELTGLWGFLSEKKGEINHDELLTHLHRLFFPEGVGIRDNFSEKVGDLRRRRQVEITQLCSEPVTDPASEILFTANALLTIPHKSNEINDLSLSDHLIKELQHIVREPQLYWYDHPIQIGVEPDKNEIIYGLRELDKAVAFEKKRGNVAEGQKISCVVSVTVTHEGLHRIAGQYLKEELQKIGGLENIIVYIFTETDTERIINEILLPAASHYLDFSNTEGFLNVFGVDGEYGRHYSYLKAIAAYWKILIDPKLKATFKIDLDQVFPQVELVRETGLSAFEHFKSPLWGAKGIDTEGYPIELGMIAGALVNEKDIGKSLFTPDVKYSERAVNPDEHIFFSTLPQAVSTEAEMMTRYDDNLLDGEHRCIQRIHVTGGTNGIRLDSLRKFRPFTPSFIGRAEDQAYILSTLFKEPVRLAYVHKDGLIMRHDKEAFAGEAIKSAYIGKLLGDYIRILFFSAYSQVLTDNLSALKKKIDPFTGCFMSRIPVTVVYLRFALKAASFFEKGNDEKGFEFIRDGSRRIEHAISLIDAGHLNTEYVKEREEWEKFYDILDIIDSKIKNGDKFANELLEQARSTLKDLAP